MLLAEIPVSGARLLFPEPGLSFLLACLLQLAVVGVHSLLLFNYYSSSCCSALSQKYTFFWFIGMEILKPQLLVDAQTHILPF